MTQKRIPIRLVSLFTFFAGALLLFACARSGEKARRPNVVFILADDLGYGDLGCYGQKEILTPNIDALASGGMRFTQHYSGSTVCAPSRCSLMTGLHTGHCRIRGNTPVLLQPEDFTLGELFRQSGYRTAAVGKWGIGHPPPPDDPAKNGFDHFFGYLSMWHAHNYYPDFLWRNGERVQFENVVVHPEEYYLESEKNLVGVASDKREYSHDLIADEALRIVEQNSRSPFFLYLAFTIPHANNEAGDVGMEVPDYGSYQDGDWPEPQKGHAAMISRMDRDIGRLVKRLTELRILENTLIVFTSDNGPHREGGNDPEFNNSNGPLRGIKRDLYEGGVRVPMIAFWAGRIEPGVTADHISAFWDFLPTIAELLETKLPQDVDGISLRPTLLGSGSQQPHEYLYWEFHEKGFAQAVRMGRWKAIRQNAGEALELYDLDRDIGETTDLAEKYPDVVRQAEMILKSARVDSPDYPVEPSVGQ